MASPSPGCGCESCQYARQRQAELNRAIRCEVCGWLVDTPEHELGCAASRDQRVSASANSPQTPTPEEGR